MAGETDLHELLRRLEREEHEVSARRATIHERLASFRNSVLEDQERQLSERRQELHDEIEKVRDPDSRRRMTKHTERLLSLVLVALAVACADSWLKAVDPAPSWALHQRSVLWAIVSAIVLLATVALSRVPSDGVTLGSGVLAGGVLGNLISAGTDHLIVPDPLFLATRNGGFAFNLADTFILAGNLMLIVALSHLVIRNRHRLPQHAPRRS